MCQCWETENVTRASEARMTIGYPPDGVQEARLVDEFRFAIDDLGAVIDELRVRALPVSRPEYGEPNCAMDTPPPYSAARDELYRLHALTGTLRGIIDRLEV